MKLQLSHRETNWKLADGAGTSSSRILPFPSAPDLRSANHPKLPATRSEQNVFNYYFHSFNREHGQFEEVIYLTLWITSALALGITIVAWGH